jgi:hypothetical protein
MKFLPILAFALLLMASCSRFNERKENITCYFPTGGPYPVISFSIKGHTAAETDTVIVNWYKEDGSFKDLVKTSIVKYSDSVFNSMANKYYPVVNRSDSLELTSYNFEIFRLSDSDSFRGYDVEILLPGAANARHILRNIIVEGNITERKTVHSGDKGYCYRKVASFEVDGSYFKNNNNGVKVSFTK